MTQRALPRPALPTGPAAHVHSWLTRTGLCRPPASMLRRLRCLLASASPRKAETVQLEAELCIVAAVVPKSRQASSH